MLSEDGRRLSEQDMISIMCVNTLMKLTRGFEKPELCCHGRRQSGKMPRGELEAGAPVVRAFGCRLSCVGDCHYFTVLFLLLFVSLPYNILAQVTPNVFPNRASVTLIIKCTRYKTEEFPMPSEYLFLN
jgi:hypothetical protein